ncbi:MAG: hypothetical protein ACH346_05085 [Chthoniobacterales bacterium]
MKNNTKLILITTLLLNCSTFRAHAYAQTQTYASAYAQEEAIALVTVSDYCDFLNHVAATDPHHLYDEAMGSNENTACIQRLGEPGSYHYEVITGRENDPITYVTWLDKARYCNWLEASEAGSNNEAPSSTTSTSTSNSHIEDVSETGVYDLTAIDKAEADGSSMGLVISKNPNAKFFIADESYDLSLKSAQSDFYINRPSVPTLSLISSSTLSSSLSSIFNEKSELLKGLAVGAFVVGCMMTQNGEILGNDATRFNDSLTSVNNNTLLTLQDFSNAAEADPTATRFIIRENDGVRSIHPQEATDESLDRSRVENQVIIGALRAALEREHPTTLVNEALPQNNELELNSLHLSAQKIRNILHKINPPRVRSVAIPRRSNITLEHFDIDSLIHMKVSRNQSALIDIYKEADAFWNEAEEAWNRRSITQFDVEEKIDILNKATELFKEEEEKFAESNEYKDNTFKKFADGAEVASDILSMINTPVVSLGGMAKAAATTARAMDYMMDEQASRTRGASEAKRHASIAARRGSIDLEGIENNASRIQAKAQQAEDAAKDSEAKETMEIAKDIIPPIHEQNQDLWTAWAEKLIKAAQLDPIHTDKVRITGMAHPLLTAEIAASAWDARIAASEKLIRSLQEKTIQKASHEEAEAEAIKARNFANAAKNSLEVAASKKVALERRLEEAKQELRDVDKQIKNLQAEASDAMQMRLKPHLENQKKLRAEIATIELTDLPSAKENIQQLTISYNRIEENALNTEEEVRANIIKSFSDEEKNNSRNLDRAYARAESDQAAKRDLFDPMLSRIQHAKIEIDHLTRAVNAVFDEACNKSKSATDAWTYAKSLCHQALDHWDERATEVEKAYQQAAQFSRAAEAAWISSMKAKAEASNEDRLAKKGLSYFWLDINRKSYFTDLSKEREGRSVWRAKTIQAEKNAEAATSIKTLMIKRSLANAKAAWNSSYQAARAFMEVRQHTTPYHFATLAHTAYEALLTACDRDIEPHVYNALSATATAVSHAARCADSNTTDDIIRMANDWANEARASASPVSNDDDNTIWADDVAWAHQTAQDAATFMIASARWKTARSTPVVPCTPNCIIQ